MHATKRQTYLVRPTETEIYLPLCLQLPDRTIADCNQVAMSAISSLRYTTSFKSWGCTATIHAVCSTISSSWQFAATHVCSPTLCPDQQIACHLCCYTSHQVQETCAHPWPLYMDYALLHCTSSNF